MSLPLPQMFGEVTEWCSYDCGGSPATHSVEFTLEFAGEKERLIQKLCDECLSKFIEKGPK